MRQQDGLTQAQLAAALRVSRLSVSQLVNGSRTVTAEMALRLGRAFSTSAEFWLNLQRQVDLSQAEHRISGTLNVIPVLRKKPAKSRMYYDLP